MLPHFDENSNGLPPCSLPLVVKGRFPKHRLQATRGRIILEYWFSSTSTVRVAGTAALCSAVLGYTSVNAPIPSERVKAWDLSSLLLSPQLILSGFRWTWATKL